MHELPTAFHVFRLLATQGVGVVRARRILDYVETRGLNLAALVENPRYMRALLSASQVESLRQTEGMAITTWNRMESMGITFLSPLDTAYPRALQLSLKEGAPLLLTVKGDLGILQRPSVGFCGSRKASEKGILVAHDCADQLASQGINIVSGYAAGVDMATHGTALERGGTTTIVLPEGIFNFRIKTDLKPLWDWDRVAVVSEFLPAAKWSVANAMQRNRTICGLSSAMILIEAGTKGGSIAAGRTCLKMSIPLFAAVYEGMPESADGNRQLIEHGARALMKKRETDRAHLEAVFSVLSADTSHPLQAVG